MRMHNALNKLKDIAKRPRIAIGLMSGTSLDGLDIALCHIEGTGLETNLRLEKFTTIPYSKEFLKHIDSIFANPDGRLIDVTKANAFVAREHAKILLSCLNNWDVSSMQVDFLASHGQTVFHAPNNDPHQYNASLQIGDGDHLAHLTQILTLSDFRQKHIAAGGEGAPLVPYADYLLFADNNEHRIMLNIGGIANYTFLPATTMHQSFNSIIFSDTGPGNTLMDELIKLSELIPTNYDNNGDLAAKGTVNHQWLDLLITKANELTKNNQSTGQEIFNLAFIEKTLKPLLVKNTKAMPSQVEHYCLPKSGHAFFDLIATLNLFTVKLIEKSFSANKLPNGSVIYVSGGGVHNKTLMRNLIEALPNFTVKSIAHLGMNPDAKEAALFAVLANETLFGNYQVFNNQRGIPATSLGKISLP